MRRQMCDTKQAQWQSQYGGILFEQTLAAIRILSDGGMRSGLKRSLVKLLTNGINHMSELNAVVSCPQFVNKIPSSEELSGRIFRDEAKEVEEYGNGVRSSWALTGCSIVFDGWTDEMGRKLVNVLADCPKGPIYIGSYDISASFGGELNALQSVIDEVIEKVGVENVVQIMTYSTSDCMEAAGRLVNEKHKTIFWTRILERWKTQYFLLIRATLVMNSMPIRNLDDFDFRKDFQEF